jgi:hypothetical protein
MKRVVTVVRAHAQRYHTLLDENWRAMDWTRPQAEQVLKRLESMIEALPLAVNQAHERIIGERQVAGNEKLLSLFEPDIHGGKAGEEVEFGNCARSERSGSRNLDKRPKQPRKIQLASIPNASGSWCRALFSFFASRTVPNNQNQSSQ